MHEHCDACGLRYLENPGDPWFFLLILDRGAFILPPIALIYFGWLPRSVPGIVLVLGLFAAVVLATTPHRYGICVALDWVTRTVGDPGPSATDSRREPPSAQGK